MIGYLVQGKVRIKIMIRVRVGLCLTLAFIIYRSNCRRSKCRTFTKVCSHMILLQETDRVLYLHFLQTALAWISSVLS